MARKTTIDGYSVILFVPTNHRRNAKEASMEADEIVWAIKRLLSHEFEAAYRPEIETQVRMTCEHCGSTWTEKNGDYNGGCCDLDEDQHQQQIAKED